MSRAFGPEELLGCYRRGVFPMAERRDDPGLFFVDPEWRAILPLNGFHAARRLARTVRSERFTVTVDRDFAGVIDGCAAPRAGREETWINPLIRSLYGDLHRRGFAHSVEARRHGVLVGGLYGVALGGAFFGESMFSTARDASKVCLVHLVARLIAGGFALLDTQFMTEHLEQFGAVELPRAAFHRMLEDALARDGRFARAPDPMSGAYALQLIAQMS
ncbi:MAG: leucyl/phenylalanyl-tRNA--protein transferase [Alphaproteobacteria bacterium]|nr:leucyl/phenylalanyl-tRNA--protein transferase [Alphaproteobacteria bacterium]